MRFSKSFMHLYVSCCCDCKHLSCHPFSDSSSIHFRKAVLSIFWTATCSSAEWTYLHMYP
ncbi:hypothetical protein GIB67_030571 [Kingdonia uniflora]|uniref:Uncharacterized protein n=1 Tax=Kingdonia uniflora TaxID=39325 RepID=A0A7J7NUE7_9MAGN|nr:hypothetical protein GIB67_030571 [Kingdonia uniflora]